MVEQYPQFLLYLDPSVADCTLRSFAPVALQMPRLLKLEWLG